MDYILFDKLHQPQSIYLKDEKEENTNENSKRMKTFKICSFSWSKFKIQTYLKYSHTPPPKKKKKNKT